MRWRVIGVVAAILLCGWYTVANFVSSETRRASPFLPDDVMRLGLDRQGGPATHFRLTQSPFRASALRRIDAVDANDTPFADNVQVLVERAFTNDHRTGTGLA